MSRYALMLCALLLAACSPDKEPPPAPKLFEEQREALDQSKEVEAMLQKQAEEQRKAAEQQAQ